MAERKDFRIEIDFRKENRRMRSVIAEITKKIEEHPEREYWMDGNTYAYVSALRVVE